MQAENLKLSFNPLKGFFDGLTTVRLRFSAIDLTTIIFPAIKVNGRQHNALSPFFKSRKAPVFKAERNILVLLTLIFFGCPVDPEVLRTIVSLLLNQSL